MPVLPHCRSTVLKNSIQVEFIYNLVLISDIQQCVSVAGMYILFHVLFHHGLSRVVNAVLWAVPRGRGVCVTCTPSLHLLIPSSLSSPRFLHLSISHRVFNRVGVY